MGIYSITESAISGLNIAQAGILTTSQNVAGTSVEGYSRRNANAIMDALAPNSLMLNGSSFAVEGFTRQYSSLIGAQLLSQQAKSSYSDTLVKYTNSVDSLVADKSAGLNSAISDFFNAMGAYAADPTNKAMAGAITGTANAVAQRMTGMSSLVNQIQSDALSSLNETVSQVNTLLPALANINQKIVDGNSPGVSAPSADLLDERDRLLSQLQKLVGGQSLINSDGTATQLVAGMPLVERAIANKVTVNADQQHVALTFNLQNGPNKGFLQTVQTLEGGQAGALLELTNSFVPSIQKRLDTVAMGLVKVANSAAQTSPGIATNLAIFGFKVADKTYSSLAANDLTGNLPAIASENDLLDLYSSLGNAISSDSDIKVGSSVGSYTKVTSLTASTNTLAGDYTITNFGDGQLRLSDSFGKSQIVSLVNSLSGGLQTLDFNQLGITLQLANTSPSLSAVSSSSVIRNNATLPIGGPASQTISNVTIQNNVLPGELNFTSVGDKLTLTSAAGGSQTITVMPGASAGQTLNFDQMGISFLVSDSSVPVKSASDIATYFSNIRVSTGDIKAGTTLPAINPTQTISELSVLGGVKAGEYTFSVNGSNLTLAGNGKRQTIVVGNGVSAGQTLNFDQLGISFKVSDSSTPVQTAATIAGYFDAKKIQVSAGITLNSAQDTKENIAAALNGQKVRVSGISNPLVNYGLNASNFISLAPSNFASYFNGNTPLISSEKANEVQKLSAVFGTSVSNLVNDVGVKVATWRSNQKADDVVLSNLKAQRDSVSGVNLDEEAANLLKYQQLYTASTKVLQAGNQMFNTLLSIMN
ncbi:flagellar basal body rod C-terminal domain-containing protein [Polynucleobacter sp. MWH-HuK1]|uniref:FlgK family flagellar hook-associated protein n=1 Tax=Polynucleobacter sp. MWH-HuK1 TaxID=1743158 RepID=UPI001C0BACC1|nr:flagellar basal body rod C-terminal domain-containing protein [Polynucleobacter sp. MWH-HuK1]MBU3565319.1 hypothetical protein [Polynucleobacter sp. MWH-HuK1]